MTSMNPLRRLAATAAIVGVTGFGAVALAGPALADDAAPATSVSVDSPAPSVDAPAAPAAPASSWIQSPLPDKAIKVQIGILKVTLQPVLAQAYQTVEANLYASQGYQITFDQHGVLVIGKKICDAGKPAAAQKNCVPADAPRF